MSTILRGRMIADLRIRNYSERTVDTYIRCVAAFANYFHRSPHTLGVEEVREYQIYLVETKKASFSLLNQSVSALRFLYGVTLGRPETIDFIPYPRPEKRLPVVLSLEEIGKFFGCVGNLKYRIVLKTMYGSGLRISEALGLRLSDIDSQRMVLRVDQGKGKKDRYTDLPPTLLSELREYWRARRPQSWLFPGRALDHPLSATAVQRASGQARRRAGIQKPVTTQTMRHCYATHQLEAGRDLRTIQMRLGHRSLNTTAIYLHVAAAGQTSPTNKVIDLLELAQADVSKR